MFAVYHSVCISVVMKQWYVQVFVIFESHTHTQTHQQQNPQGAPPALLTRMLNRVDSTLILDVAFFKFPVLLGSCPTKNIQAKAIIRVIPVID